MLSWRKGIGKNKSWNSWEKDQKLFNLFCWYLRNQHVQNRIPAFFSVPSQQNLPWMPHLPRPLLISPFAQTKILSYIFKSTLFLTSTTKLKGNLVGYTFKLIPDSDHFYHSCSLCDLSHHISHVCYWSHFLNGYFAYVLIPLWSVLKEVCSLILLKHSRWFRFSAQKNQSPHEVLQVLQGLLCLWLHLLFILPLTTVASLLLLKISGNNPPWGLCAKFFSSWKFPISLIYFKSFSVMISLVNSILVIHFKLHFQMFSIPYTLYFHSTCHLLKHTI